MERVRVLVIAWPVQQRLNGHLVLRIEWIREMLLREVEEEERERRNGKGGIKKTCQPIRIEYCLNWTTRQIFSFLSLSLSVPSPDLLQFRRDFYSIQFKHQQQQQTSQDGPHGSRSS